MNRKIGTILSFLSILAEIFSALLLTPLIIRSFGQSEYGVYTLVLSITSYLALLDLGVGNSVVKFMSKFRANGDLESQNKFMGVTTIYYGVIVFAMIVIGAVLFVLFPYLFSNGLSVTEIELGRELLILSVFNIAVSIGTSGYFYTVLAYENFYVSKGLPIVFSVIRIALCVLALNAGFKSPAVLSIQLITNLVLRTAVVVFVLFVIRIRPTIKGVDGRFVKSVVSYSLLILLQMIAAQVNNMLDQILIAALVSSSSVILGIYGVGAQVSHYYQTFGGVVNGVTMPGVVKTSETDSSSETIQREMIRVGRFSFMLVGLIFVVFAVYGQSFIRLWAGEDNSAAYFVALLLMIPNVIILTQDVGLKFLWALDKQKFLSITKIIIVLLNVILTVFLIKWDPLIGASLGTFLSLLFGDVLLMQVVLKKELGINLSKYYLGIAKGIIPSLIASTICGLLFSFVNMDYLLMFFVGSSLMLAVYLICLLWFGMNANERRILSSAKARLFCKEHKTW